MESAKPPAVDLGRRPLPIPMPILKSKDYISSLGCGWLPVHGLEFFTMFVQELVPKWENLLDAAEAHLFSVVSSLSLLCYSLLCTY
jgi:hypothetical protein